MAVLFLFLKVLLPPTEGQTDENAHERVIAERKASARVAEAIKSERGSDTRKHTHIHIHTWLMQRDGDAMRHQTVRCTSSAAVSAAVSVSLLLSLLLVLFLSLSLFNPFLRWILCRTQPCLCHINGEAMQDGSEERIGNMH